jgi:hypothetical protein
MEGAVVLRVVVIAILLILLCGVLSLRLLGHRGGQQAREERREMLERWVRHLYGGDRWGG